MEKLDSLGEQAVGAVQQAVEPPPAEQSPVSVSAT
jgi:hypothetical protein